MTLLVHATLPVVLYNIFFKRAIFTRTGERWFDWAFDIYYLAIAIVASLPDTLPIASERYKLIDKLYTRIHRPWQFDRVNQYIVYATWLIFLPIGLHCVMDIAFHTPEAKTKNFRLMVLLESALWFCIIWRIVITI